jgi:hypothetical protein
MGRVQRVQVVGPTGLCFLTLLLLRLAWTPPAATPLAQGTKLMGLRPLRGPCDAALRVARCWRLRAMQEVSLQFDALEAWDPEAPGTRDLTMWRRLMARDRNGDLGRAREAAQRALQLARTPRESYQVGLLLTRIYCEGGDHKAELRQARQVLVLQPKNSLSLITMHRAAECNGLQPLAREMNARLAALFPRAEPSPRHPHCPGGACQGDGHRLQVLDDMEAEGAGNLGDVPARSPAWGG